jgi:hypothetical protein
MVTFDDVHKLVSASRGASPCLAECWAEVASGTYSEVGPGRVSAKEALQTFRIRRETAEAAGIGVCGLDQLLSSLAAIEEAEPVLLFHLSGADRVFTLPVIESTSTLVGCIRVLRLTQDD